MLARRNATTPDGSGLGKLGQAAGNVSPSSPSPTEHVAALRGVAFSPKPGSNLALTAGADGVAYLWDVSRYERPGFAEFVRGFVPEPPGGALTDIAFSPDGEQFATAGLDGTVRVWKVEREDQTQPTLIRAEAGTEAGAALGVTFSPRGTYLLTSWASGRMQLFRRNGDDWKPVTDWLGSAARLTPQLFDRDERFVVTPNAGRLRVKGETGSVRLWDVSSKERLIWTKAASPAGPVADLAVHPVSRAIAAATLGPSGTVDVWDDAGNRIGTPIHHPAGVERLAFSPDGKALATEAEDGMGRIWAWPHQDGQAPRTLTGLTGPSPVLVFSEDSSHLISDGGYLATDGAASVGQVWDSSRNTAIPLKGPRDRVVTLAFSGAGDVPEVLSINRANRLQRWSMKEAERGDPRGSCRGPNLKPTAAAIQPGGVLAASGTDDGTLKLWRTDTGEEVAELRAHTLRVNSLVFSVNGRRLVSAGDDGLACVWAVPDPDTLRRESPQPVSSVDPKLLARLEHNGQKVSVARFLDPQGQRVITGTGDLKRMRWQPDRDLSKTAMVCHLHLMDAKPQPTQVVPLAALKRGNVGDDAPIGVLTAAVSPVDARVFLGCGGPDARFNLVWSPASNDGKSDSQSYVGHTEAILDVAVSPDGQRLATASADNTARVWTIGRSEAVELRGHSGDLVSVAFSPNSQNVLTISRQDGTARVWDRDGGEPLYVLGARRAGFNSATINDPPGPRQYTDDVVAAAFSPDGKLVVTAQGDGTARAYRLALCGDFDDLKEVTQLRLDGFMGKSPRNRER